MNVAVIQLGALGDTVVSIPAIHAFRRAHGPRTRVLALAAGGEKGELLVAGGAAHEAIDASRAELAPLFAPGGARALPAAVADRLRACGAALVLLGHAPEVEGNLRALGVRDVICSPARPKSAVHVVDHLLAAAGRLGSAGPGNQIGKFEPNFPKSEAKLTNLVNGTEGRGRAVPRLRVPPAERAAARAVLAGMGIAPGRGLLVHPGSGGARKCWPAERFVALAERARDALGRRAAIVLGPVEMDERPYLATDARAHGLPVIADPGLVRLAALVHEAGAYVGNDAGATHLAAAAGARTVAIFGPSEVRIWAPRGAAGVRIVAAPGGVLANLDVEGVLASAGDLLHAAL